MFSLYFMVIIAFDFGDDNVFMIETCISILGGLNLTLYMPFSAMFLLLELV